ncbi:hypothetical protein DENSPDRAFT_838651 [Dentipellis sp. KUC8613]|nr:hypothetical protein DENSPDRAFT_838651 [Dentipellis sp. KUC8613]
MIHSPASSRAHVHPTDGWMPEHWGTRATPSRGPCATITHLVMSESQRSRYSWIEHAVGYSLQFLDQRTEL